MWDKIERVLKNLSWYVSVVIGFSLSMIVGFTGHWGLMSLFLFSIILTYAIQIGIIFIFQFLIKQKFDKDDKDDKIPENIVECFILLKSFYIK